PVMIRRQVELADAAGNARALFDRHQPLVVAKMLADLAGLGKQAAAGGVDLGQYGVECRRLDRRIVLERREQLALPLELLQDIGLEIGPRSNIDDFEQRE